MTCAFHFFEKERALKASAITHEKSLEYTYLRVGTQLSSKTRRCYDFNVNPSGKLEQHADDQDRVPLERRRTRGVSYLPDLEMRLSTALCGAKNKDLPLNGDDTSMSFALYDKREKGKMFLTCRKRTLKAEGPANRTNLPGLRLMRLPVAGARVRSKQIVRNAVYSGTRGGWLASGRRPCRGGLPGNRFSLPLIGCPSAQFASSRHASEFRLRIRWSIPRAGTFRSMAKTSCLRDASAPAVQALLRMQ